MSSLSGVQQILFQAPAGYILDRVVNFSISIDPLTWWSIVIRDRDNNNAVFLQRFPAYSLIGISLTDYFYDLSFFVPSGGPIPPLPLTMPNRNLNLTLVLQAGGNPLTGLIDAASFDFSITLSTPGGGDGIPPIPPSQVPLAIGLVAVAGLSIAGLLVNRYLRRRHRKIG